MEEFFFHAKKTAGEPMLGYISRFRAAYRKMQRHGVTEVPELIQTYFLLRRAGLSLEDRRLALASAGGELDLGAVT